MKIGLFALSALLLGTAGVPVLRAQEVKAGAVHGPHLAVEFLSDTAGVNLAPYMQQLVADVNRHWQVSAAVAAGQFQHGPEETVLNVSIGPKGDLASMHLEGRAGEEALDKAAWGAMTESSFAPLPAGLPSQPLRLRLRFVVD